MRGSFSEEEYLLMSGCINIKCGEVVVAGIASILAIGRQSG